MPLRRWRGYCLYDNDNEDPSKAAEKVEGTPGRIASAARRSTLRRHTPRWPFRLRRRRPVNAAGKVEGKIIEEGLETIIKKEKRKSKDDSRSCRSFRGVQSAARRSALRRHNPRSPCR
mmetsp:Transcript_26072/g.56047  ORF Transcript_26072/g.56047 Transcript_26072/m.56047 type:complete len:118 (-) Transcript_26072:350-703(-)